MILHRVAIQAIISIVYFLLAIASYTFATVEGNATLIGFSSGLAVAAIARYGPNILYGVYLAGFLASKYTGNSADVSLLIALGNILEPLIALLILNRFQFSVKLYHLKDFLLLICSGMAGAIFSAVMDCTALLLAGYISHDLMLSVAVHWWMGNTIGVILLAPLLLFVVQTSFHKFIKTHYLELSLLLSVALYLSVTLFAGIPLFGQERQSNYAHYILIVLVWGLIRFNHQTIALITMMFFSMGMWGFVHQQGFFFNGVESFDADVQTLFQYIFILSVGSMTVAYMSKTQGVLSQALIKCQTEIYIFNQDDLQFEFINQSALSNLGLSKAKWQKMSLLDIQSPESRQYVSSILSRLKLDETTCEVYQSWHLRHDGSSYPVEVRLQQTEQAGHRCYLATANDISERLEHQMYKDLGDNVCEHSTQAVLICDENSHIIRVNPAFMAITGYSADEVIGAKPNLLKSGKHDKSFFQAMRNKLDQEGEWSGELYNRHKAGHLYLIHLTIKKIVNVASNKVHYVSMFSDITAEREHTLQLKHSAEHDLLTALPNRKRLHEEFKHASAMAHRQQQKLALLFLDLDGFKPINDTHSHQIGDRVLQKIAERLNNTVRDSDIVCRIGGDEFIILMTNIDDENVSQLFVDKIKKSIAQPMYIEGLTLQLTVSIGAALYPIDAADLDSLISIADDEMYQDKQSERPQDS